jgi:putative ATP-binding cassette transporter
MEEVARVLELVGLGHLVERIEEDAPWDQILSGGENQRLAFVRIFLRRPDVIVLDEATSALDPRSQDRMMEILAKELPETTIISVGHREELELFHDRKIVLKHRPGGARLVGDIDLSARRPRERRLRRWSRRLSLKRRAS